MGGAQVTLSGIGLDEEGIACRFGDTISEASLVSSSRLLCSAPPRDHVGVVRVVLVNILGDSNGVEVPSADAVFEYGSAPTVSKLTPSWGPSNAGSIVNVYGENLPVDGSILCSFGGQVSEGSGVSSTQM